MDLFNKTKLRLNSPATGVGLRDLCKIGVMRPSQFLRALSLIKNKKDWGVLLSSLFFVFSVVFITTAAGLFLTSIWNDLSFFYQILLCQMVFISSVVTCFLLGLDRIVGRFFLVLAMINIGFMLWLISQYYPTSKELWVVFAHCSALILLWVVCARSSLIWGLGLIIFNVSAFLWGYQSGIPNYTISWQGLMLLMAIANALVLVLIEITLGVFIKKEKSHLWLILLIYSFSLALYLAGYSIFLNEFLSVANVYFAFISLFFIWFYFYKYPKYSGLIVVGMFVSVFVLMLVLGVWIESLFLTKGTFIEFIALFEIIIAVTLFVVISVLSWAIFLLNNRKEKGLIS